MTTNSEFIAHIESKLHNYEQTSLILFLSLGLIGTAFADNIGKLKSSNACVIWKEQALVGKTLA